VWLRLAVSTEIEHGRFFLVSPVFAGAGAILWFVLGSAPAELRMVAWFAAFAVVALMAGPGRRLIRNLALAGLLCVTGMFAAQFETWSKATIILDTAVTTTIIGRVERREGDGRGRWRYIVSVSSTQSLSPSVSG
jgi:hypothetical protein